MCFRVGLTNLKAPFEYVRGIVPHYFQVSLPLRWLELVS